MLDGSICSFKESRLAVDGFRFEDAEIGICLSEILPKSSSAPDGILQSLRNQARELKNNYCVKI